MRLLIAGSHGQVARSLVEVAAVDNEVTAVALGRPALDLSVAATLPVAFTDARPDVVINAAAYTAVDKAESEPDAARALNAEGARRCAAAAARLGVPVIHVSTDYVFDGSKSGAYMENDPPAPANVYGMTKLEGERAVAAANPRHVILRTSWVYSAFGRNFVKTMLQLAGERDEIRVVDDQIGCPTYAPHLAVAILAVAKQVRSAGEGGPWGIYHATGRGATSWCGLAREVMARSAALGGHAARIVPIATADYPTPARRPPNSVLDGARLDRVFALRLPAWQEGVADCVERLIRA